MDKNKLMSKQSSCYETDIIKEIFNEQRVPVDGLFQEMTFKQVRHSKFECLTNSYKFKTFS